MARLLPGEGECFDFFHQPSDRITHETVQLLLTLFLATGLGIPVSTTHPITGAIVGLGAEQKLSAVGGGVAGRIVWAWVRTIPCSAFMSAVAWWIAAPVL